MEARRAHNPEVVGSSPASATKENTTQSGGVFFGSRQELKQPPGYEADERSSLGKRPDRRQRRKQGGERSAAVGVQRSRTAGKAHTGHRKPGCRTRSTIFSKIRVNCLLGQHNMACIELFCPLAIHSYNKGL